ncbi:sigma-70 family RNA polymerase sigma factor [Leptolyngbya sp. 15MV]|nr:sigma-70 family RNA polymerase sigma factor [Leptolyngbya sp. 15MV]
MGQVARVTRLLDEYLVTAAMAGDEKAFGQLVGRWNRRLVAHAWRLTGDREMALDAVQSGWADIVRGLGHLQDARAFPAWAYRIVSRACSRQVGQGIRRRELAQALGSQPETSSPMPDVGCEGSALQAAIRALPSEQRAAIALFHFEEMSVAEVAVALDVPAGTVKTRLMHGRRKLREALEGADQ